LISPSGVRSSWLTIDTKTGTPALSGWYLRHKETDRRVYGGGPFNALLVVSTVAIGILGVYTILSTLGIFTIG
jgi:hypothetical protein